MAEPQKKSFSLLRAIDSLIILIILIIACIVAVSAWDDSRAEDDFAVFLGDMSDKNIQMDKDMLFPPLPPASQNFAMVPSLVEIMGKGDLTENYYTLDEVDRSLYEPHTPYVPGNIPYNSWRRGLEWTPDDIRLILSVEEEVKTGTPAENLAYCEREYGALLEQLRKELKRPYCQFNINFLLGPKYPYEHLKILHDVALVATARSVTYLQLRKYDKAFADQIFAWDIIKRIDSDHTLLSSIVQQYAFVYSLQPLWEGIAGHRWSKEQLTEFLSKLKEFDFISSFSNNYAFEVAWTLNYQLDRLKKGDKPEIKDFRFDKKTLNEWVDYLVPVGWIKLNLIHLAKECMKYREVLFCSGSHRIQPLVYREFVNKFDTTYAAAILPECIQVYGYRDGFFDEIVPECAARGQCFADMAVIACKAELFYAQHSKYPENLTEMVLEQEQLPIDVIVGGAYHYTNHNTTFLVYSFAWDGLDNFGQVGRRSPSGMEDWVWPASGYMWSNGSDTGTLLEWEEAFGQVAESE